MRSLGRNSHRLFGQLLTDEAIAIPGKQFINVMAMMAARPYP
ncbi:hypothetical protein [Coleofasciculus sp. H7-2]